MKIATDFAACIAELLAPFAEVALFDGQQEVAAWNRLVPDSTPPEGPTQLHITTANDGRILKEVTLACPTSEPNPSLLIRIRVDITAFAAIGEQLALFTRAATEATSATPQWQQQVDQAISQFLADRGLTLSGATRSEKRELVTGLRDAGFLQYKQASQYLAKTLGLSRATIYNYLKLASTLESVQVHQVDAFTDQRFGGNPAGVVLDAQELSDAVMRKITRELNVSETAFVLPSAEADLKLRYFTPTGDEVKFCGHSTVGAMYMLGHENRLGIAGPGDYTFTVETGAGVLPMRVSIDAEDAITVEYQAPRIALEDTEIDHAAFAKILGISVDQLDTRYPVLWEATNADLFAVVPSLDKLRDLQVDTRNMERYGKEHGVVAYCLMTPETYDSLNAIHCRCYAPAVGIPEDPFTGSVQGGLAAYATEYGLICDPSKEFGVEQGHSLERPGSVRIQLTKHNDHLNGQVEATIRAQAVHCFSTQIKMH